MRSVYQRLLVTMSGNKVLRRGINSKQTGRTIALWHFDELSGNRKFSDASGNAYHLEGKNGAKTSIPLAVEAEGKLTTIWGRLKQ